MKRRTFIASAIASILSAAAFPDKVLSQSCLITPKYPFPGLPDIAFITYMPQYSPNGLVILYNPVIVSQAGPYLSAFFEAHEYGHACLNHINQQFFMQAADPLTRSWMSQTMELQADSFATQVMCQYGNIISLQQAVAWFSQQIPNPNNMLLSTHPPGPARAQNIRQTAYQLGVII